MKTVKGNIPLKGPHVSIFLFFFVDALHCPVPTRRMAAAYPPGRTPPGCPAARRHLFTHHRPPDHPPPTRPPAARIASRAPGLATPAACLLAARPPMDSDGEELAGIAYAPRRGRESQ
jgi:hypothetical protein